MNKKTFLLATLVANLLLSGGMLAFAQIDSFRGSRSVVVDGPANDATAVTESDATLFVDMSRGLYIGTGGNCTVTTRGGTVVEFKNVPDGAVLPVRAKKLMEASTVADVVNLHD